MIKRKSIWPSLLIGGVVLTGVVSAPLLRPAFADDRDERAEHEFRADMVVPGIYPGRWHSDSVRFIIEKVTAEGRFSGVVHFDKSSRFPDALFTFTGEISPHGTIHIDRDPNNDPQVSKAGEPRREGDKLVWVGETTGPDLDMPYPFELRIPLGDRHPR
jgi:hypothetical protein